MTRTLDGSNAAEVSVDLHHATVFWAALTGQPSSRAARAANPQVVQPAHPRLAPGVAAVWLAGHKTTPPENASHPRAGEQLTTVTLDFTDADWCTWATCASSIWAARMYRVDGSDAGALYRRPNKGCLTTDPCHTVRLVYQDIPAGVYYFAANWEFALGNVAQEGIVVNPEFTVPAGGAHLSFHLDDLRQATVDAPQQAQPIHESVRTTRRFLNDSWGGALIYAAYLNMNVWLMPTKRVTQGTFKVDTSWVLAKPLVSLTETSPQHLDLQNTYYPAYNDPILDGVPRFSGTQTLPVVDAGTGTEGDFAGLDVRGKLVLLRPPLGERGGCGLLPSTVLSRALDAGAAGVVAFFQRNIGGHGLRCTLPVIPDWLIYHLPVVPLPVVSIPTAQGDRLADQLSQRPVTLTVADHSSEPYLYDLAFYHEGRVPDSAHYTVTKQQLAAIETTYHASQPNGSAAVGFVPRRLDDGVGFFYRTGLDIPKTRTEYIGPISPAVVYRRYFYPPAGGFVSSANHSWTVWDTFEQRGASETEDFFAAPADIPGAVPAVSKTRLRSGVGVATQLPCAGCRAGDAFVPYMYSRSADPRIVGAAAGNVFGYGHPGEFHLYQGDDEIPVQRYFGLLTYFNLPPDRGLYRLTFDDGDSFHATWHFTSAAPTGAKAPPAGTFCYDVESSGGPCQAQPLVFLRYDAAVDLHNAVTAPGGHKIRVTAYHQDPSAPRVTHLQLWTSTDGGVDWHKAKLVHRNRRTGMFTLRYRVRNLANTSGTVSIKARARDAAGNTVSQTVIDAFNLTSAGNG